VLIYIQPGDSDAIVDWVGTNMDASLFVVYEQINPTDAFGAMMLRNLKVLFTEMEIIIGSFQLHLSASPSCNLH
jgi:hypothetical protein